MFKIICFFLTVVFCTHSYAYVDIELACQEQEEQKKSLLTKMSTSLKEANLAGQCTGYHSYYNIDLEHACSEFIEQKKSLLQSLSTSNIEANLAGRCVGATYRIAEDCGVNTSSIDYVLIAETATSVKSVRIKLECYGARYGR
ncbi:hypothetical protein [Pseudocolwellia agarivorans]|uniref:hypothetical protein n=1 Tax=Pseudocolwellia agarivorans TaxID=1911682 RepID=UPI003F880E32